jgi:NTE family protein
MAVTGQAQPSRAQWLRRLARRRRNSVAFVLSGGGPLAALQVGALRALFEHDIRPDVLVGTSAGALNATWMAWNPTPSGIVDLEWNWRNLRNDDLFPGGRFKASWARMLVKGNRVFETSGLRALLERTIGLDARFEDAQAPLLVTTTDLETGKERVFGSGRVLEPLLASSAMPGIFPPVEIEGRLYIDGGVANNVPIAPAVQMGVKTIYVFDATSHSHQRRPLLRPIDYLLHAFSLARSQRLELDLVHYADKVKIVLLPTPRLDFFVPFASLEHTATLIAAGYDRTNQFLSGTQVETVEDVEHNVEIVLPAE